MNSTLTAFFCCAFTFSLLGQSSVITVWKENAIGAIWNDSTKTVAYGKKDANGFYKIYLSDSTGNNEEQLSFSGWDSNRHQWAEEWHPSGEYLFCYIEKSEYVSETTHTRIPDDAIPGYGAYTDIWLVKRDGSEAWQLTDLPNDYSHGVIHGAISKDGSLFAWSERIAAPNVFDLNLAAGAYVLKVAEIQLNPSPSLANIQTFKPGNVLAANELESFSNDNASIAFYSTYETKNLFETPIYNLNRLSGQITPLTNESFSQAPTYNPSGTKIVFMTGKDCDIFPMEIQGADWWQMNPNGTNKQRITRMNVSQDPQSVNHYRLAGSISFVSDSVFFGGVMSEPLGLQGYTVSVRILSTINEDLVPELYVFPNPTTDQLTVHIYNIEASQHVQISNSLGKVIQSQTLGEVSQINVSELAAGVYFISCTDNPGISKRFIKL